MLATIIALAVILIWAALVIYFIVRDKKKARKTGIPKGCFSCAAFKQGNCPSHENCGGKK